MCSSDLEITPPADRGYCLTWRGLSQAFGEQGYDISERKMQKDKNPGHAFPQVARLHIYDFSPFATPRPSDLVARSQGRILSFSYNLRPRDPGRSQVAIAARSQVATSARSQVATAAQVVDRKRD